MNILLLSMPDSFEHMPSIVVRIPNGGLTSLAGNVDPHHRVAVADLVLAQRQVRATIEGRGGRVHALAGRTPDEGPVLATWDICSENRPVAHNGAGFVANICKMRIQSTRSILLVFSGQVPIFVKERVS